jgi:hypothetical protein
MDDSNTVLDYFGIGRKRDDDPPSLADRGGYFRAILQSQPRARANRAASTRFEAPSLLIASER